MHPVCGIKKNIQLETMETYEREHFIVYYEVLGQATLRDIGDTLEENYPLINNFFNLDQHQKSRVAVYDNVDRFQHTYLGFFLSWLYDDSAVGAAYQDLVLLTSPENPGTQHTYADMLEIAVHEFVHTCVYRLNEYPNIWLDEGLATYLAGQRSPLPASIPEFADFQEQDMSFFWENDGYAVSYYYVEFLIREFGSEDMVRLIQTNDYQGALGESELDVYNRWLAYLETEYSASQ